MIKKEIGTGQFFSVILLMLFLNGCTSLMCRESNCCPDPPYYCQPMVYKGTRSDLDTIHRISTGNLEGRPILAMGWPIMLPLIAVDMVLSAVVDTICLPYDLIQSRKK